MRTTDIFWGSPNELATSVQCSGLWVALCCCYPSIKVATDRHFKPSQKHFPHFPCNCSRAAKSIVNRYWKPFWKQEDLLLFQNKQLVRVYLELKV